MALKDILLHLDNSPGCDARIELAVNLAQAHGAHLKGLYVLSHSYYAPRHGGTRESLAAGIQERFTAKTAAAGVSAEWLLADWSVVGVSITEIITLYTYYADLVIIGQPDQGDPDRSIPADLPERLGLGGGRPQLVVPYTGSFPMVGERVMVAWKAGRESVRAVNDAMPLLKKAKHVSVVTVESAVARESSSDDSGQELCIHLARHGVPAVHEKIASPPGFPIGDLLLNYGCEQKMDLLVMGGYAQTRRGAFVLGPIAAHLLGHLTLPVLISH
jgi:nucleotide-binding universal stress UspA family protein